MTLTVKITKNVYGGDGLGRLGDGRVVFVPGAFTGETVKVEIVEEKRRFVRARLVSVEEPIAGRLSATDRDFTANRVPGMVYADVAYADELQFKAAQLNDFLAKARYTGITPRFLQREGLSPFNYRNKVVYHFAKVHGKWVIGYRSEPEHQLVDVENDPLAVPAINAELPEIRRNLLTLLTTGPEAVRKATERKEKLTIRWSFRTGVKWWLGEAEDPVVIKEDTDGCIFEVPAGGFYQVNPNAGETLVQEVVRRAIEPDSTGFLLDLYCGVGVFGICALKKAPELQLTGVESGRDAIAFAKRNAIAAGVSERARFHVGEVGRNLRRIRIGGRSTVVIDPPRGGLEPGVASWLAQSKARRIVYVSCDPATLMRDLHVLTSAYSLVDVAWLDMFPRTARFETVAILDRKAPKRKAKTSPQGLINE